MEQKYAHGSKRQKCIGCSIPSFWPFSCFSALLLFVIWLTPGPEGKIDSQFNRKRQIDFRHCSALKEQHTRVQTCLVQLEIIHLGWIITDPCMIQHRKGIQCKKYNFTIYCYSKQFKVVQACQKICLEFSEWLSLLMSLSLLFQAHRCCL